MALTQVSSKGIKNATLLNEDVNASAAIAMSKLALSITNSEINASAAISKSKIENLINNNADNRVITGSGTANTLNGESLVTIDSNGRLTLGLTAGGHCLTASSAGSTYGGALKLRNTVTSNHDWLIGVGGGDGAYVAGRGLMIRDETTGANRVAISTSGYVGIGTVNPQANLHLKVTGTDSPYQQFQSSSANSFVGTAHADNNLSTGSKAGNLVLRGQTGVAISGSNGTTTQVKIDSDGLKFNNDTAAANALDDYEEGTYTPAIVTNGTNPTLTYTMQSGQYTKVGNLVYVTFDVRYTNKTNNGSGTIFVSLPITANSVSLYHLCVLRGARCTALPTSVTQYQGSHAIIPATARFEPNTNDGSGNATTITGGNLATSGRIVGSCVYQA